MEAGSQGEEEHSEVDARARQASDLDEAEIRIEQIQAALQSDSSASRLACCLAEEGAAVVSLLLVLLHDSAAPAEDLEARAKRLRFTTWRTLVDVVETALASADAGWATPGGRAADLLGQLSAVLDEGERDATAKALMEGVEAAQMRWRVRVNVPLLRALLGALVKLRPLHAFRWMMANFITSDRSKADLIATAHETMAAVTGLPGALRLAAARDMIRTYAPVEHASLREDAWRTFWEVLGPKTIGCVRRLCGEPRGPDGHPLKTMAALALWLVENGDPTEAPWRDE